MYRINCEKPGWEKFDLPTGDDWAKRFWKMEKLYYSPSERVNEPRATTETKRATESYVVSLSYSIPSHWPKKYIDACQLWFQSYGTIIFCEWNETYGKWRWKKRDFINQTLTVESIKDDLVRARGVELGWDESRALAEHIMAALGNGKMFNGEEYMDDLYQEEEKKMSRTLYEVFVVNINDTQDIVVKQIVSESDTKAKMKVATMIDLEGKNIDDMDFFAVEIGRVREVASTP